MGFSVLRIGAAVCAIAMANAAFADPHDHGDWRNGTNHGDWHGHHGGWHGPRGGSNVFISYGTPYAPYYGPRYYGGAYPYYPAPYYYERGPRYYTSYYYTQRPIPIETASPYVEVRCGRQPITGTVVGGATGALIGNQFGRGHGRTAATIGGALLGVIIGHDIDTANESCAYQALEYAQPNTQVGWADPDPNADSSYTITPGAISRSQDGRYCREYQAKVLVGNRMQDGYGHACRQPDGSWQVVD